MRSKLNSRGKNIINRLSKHQKKSKNWSFSYNLQSSKKFWESSMNEESFGFQDQNNVPWWKLSGKNAQYKEIDVKHQKLGDFENLGF